jgi:hypothetical protein
MVLGIHSPLSLFLSARAAIGGDAWIFLPVGEMGAWGRRNLELGVLEWGIEKIERKN